MAPESEKNIDKTGQMARLLGGVFLVALALMLALRSSLSLSSLLEADTMAHDLSYVFGIAGPVVAGQLAARIRSIQVG